MLVTKLLSTKIAATKLSVTQTALQMFLYCLGEDAYLRKAYALQIPKVKQGLAKLAAKSRTSLQTLLHVFGSKLQNDLFS